MIMIRPQRETTIFSTPLPFACVCASPLCLCLPGCARGVRIPVHSFVDLSRRRLLLCGVVRVVFLHVLFQAVWYVVLVFKGDSLGTFFRQRCALADAEVVVVWVPQEVCSGFGGLSNSSKAWCRPKAGDISVWDFARELIGTAVSRVGVYCPGASRTNLRKWELLYCVLWCCGTVRVPGSSCTPAHPPHPLPSTHTLQVLPVARTWACLRGCASKL